MRNGILCLICFAIMCCSCSNKRQNKTLETEGQPVRVLFMGDSVTDGNWGGGGAKPSRERNQKDQNHIFGHGFMFLCAAHYMAYEPGKYQFVNHGVSGYTLEDLSKWWGEDCIDVQPDVVSILIGINDIEKYIRTGNTSVSGFDYETWEKTYRKLIDRALDSHPERRVILCTPFAIHNGTIRDLMVNRLGDVVKKIAKDYGFPCLDYQKMFDKAIASHKGINEKLYIWDGIHPTAGGHQLMADLWMETFNDIMGNTNSIINKR